MLTYDKLEVFNMSAALRGMRNPLDSWHKRDTRRYAADAIEIGPNDMGLAKRLINAGPEHRKFLRQIFISVDITAPLYWWKEFDTYKIGTSANSCSTMHKITSRPFTKDQFSFDRVDNNALDNMDFTTDQIINTLEGLRQAYLLETDQDVKRALWDTIIQLLPSSYNQMRTVTMTYENALNMYNQRKNHKLPEWRVDFMKLIDDLPYANELIKGDE